MLSTDGSKDVDGETIIINRKPERRARGLLLALVLSSIGFVLGIVPRFEQHKSTNEEETQLFDYVNPFNRTLFDVNCNDFDDDKNYPSITLPGETPTDHTDCQVQDGEEWCDLCQSNVVCTKYCGNAEALCSHNPNGAFQYVNPCLYEMIRDLPKVCADTFEDVPPLTSRNAEPTYSIDSMFKPLWSCPLHSMCQACYDEKSSLNKYCRAVLSYYHFSFGAARDFLHDLADDAGGSYWCQPETLQMIEDGSFSDTLSSSSISFSEYSVKTFKQ